jgi:hypothetical protein
MCGLIASSHSTQGSPCILHTPDHVTAIEATQVLFLQFVNLQLCFLANFVPIKTDLNFPL